MKKLFLFLLMAFLAQGAWATNYCSGDAKGCWLFTEGSGTTVADSTGNGNTGTFLSSGHPAWESNDLPVRSYIKWAATWDGATDKVTTGITANQFPTNATAWSLVAWVKDTSGSTSTPYRIIDKSSGTQGPNVGLSANGGIQGIQLGVAGGTQLLVSSNSAISASAWSHVAVTWDGSTTATNVKIYINGLAVGGYNQQQNGVSLTDNSASNLLIGSRNADNTRVWHGSLTEMAVWNRVLSSAEVADIYNHGLMQNHFNTITGNSIIRNSTMN